jgi:hypothetical protein
MPKAGNITSAQLNGFAELVDELARDNYGYGLTIAVLGDAPSGFRVATTLTQAQLADALRVLLARVESELAEGAS